MQTSKIAKYACAGSSRNSGKRIKNMIANVIEKDTLEGIAAPKVITSDAQNERYISVLLELEKKTRLTAKEKEFAELLTVLVETYEEEHYPIRAASPVEVLTELMEANNLKQKDLAPMPGSESVVSEILRGKRELNKGHIERLSKRFGVSPAVFF
jgi:HTH-type transcriptional regulator / antitoxin HigA